MMKRHIICIQTMEIIIIQIEAQEEHSFHVEVFWAVTPCTGCGRIPAIVKTSNLVPK